MSDRVTFLSVDRRRDLSRSGDRLTRFGDLELLLRSSLRGDRCLLGDLVFLGDDLLGERLGDLLGDRLGDLAALTGDLGVLMGDLRRGDLLFLRLGDLFLGGLIRFLGDFRDLPGLRLGDRDLRLPEDRSSGFIFTEIVPDPDTTRLSLSEKRKTCQPYLKTVSSS